MKTFSPQDAVKIIKPGDRVFIHSAAAAPQVLIDAMVQRAPELHDVEIVHLHTECDAKYAAPEYEGTFRVNSLFIGANVRRAVNEGRADYVPIFLSEVPLLFRRGILPVDVALIQVSPPDRHGYCSLGVSVDTTLAVVENARHVIAVVNPRMPRTLGDGMIPIRHLQTLVEDDRRLPEILPAPPNEIQRQIGEHVAGLVEDGATLQTGIGAIPNAVLASLSGHADLGIHTEMFSDGVVDLVERGVITGKYKKKHKGVIASGFAMGSHRLYEFVHDNPMVRMLDIQYINNVAVISKNHKMTTINSAVEVDLTGQVCSDSIGTRFYSGVGGQMDFIRGASLCDGGKAIIALPSVTLKGESRIVSYLKKGAGVVASRANVHYVATEYGVVNLFGKNVLERARLLIEIAHPDHRERLDQEFFMTLR